MTGEKVDWKTAKNHMLFNQGIAQLCYTENLLKHHSGAHYRIELDFHSKGISTKILYSFDLSDWREINYSENYLRFLRNQEFLLFPKNYKPVVNSNSTNAFEIRNSCGVLLGSFNQLPEKVEELGGYRKFSKMISEEKEVDLKDPSFPYIEAKTKNIQNKSFLDEIKINWKEHKLQGLLGEFEEFEHLTELLINIRMSINGSADPWRLDDYQRAYEYLIFRKNKFAVDILNGHIDSFDCSVLAMLIEVINMIKYSVLK